MLRDFDPVQDLLDAIYEPEDDDHFQPMPTPASASAQAAALRRSEAERKRAERAKRRAAGVPDARAVDAAIASALALVLRRNGAPALVVRNRTVEGLQVHLRPVLQEAILTLVARGVARQVAAQAVQARLLWVDEGAPPSA